MNDEESLRKKIQELEEDLSKRDQDLKIYKRELSKANTELERLIVQVNDQLRQAVKIQKFLVPTEFPNIQGFEFSTKFSSSSVSGGDYFDIFEHFDKMRFGLFLSSASGYGMSSIFLSVLMKLTYAIEDSKNNTPQPVMEEILQELEKECQAKDKASIFYGVFDRRKFRLTYCNVGQPLVIYYQASTGRIDLLPSTPGPYSKAEGVSALKLKEGTLDLNPQDKLILCSEGFLALQNSEGIAWGLDELLSIVKQNVKKPVHELRNEIFYQASKFSSTQTRDLTVLVIEVKERIMKLATDLT